MYNQVDANYFSSFSTECCERIFVHQTSQIRMARNSLQTATLPIKTGRKLDNKVSLHNSSYSSSRSWLKITKMRSIIIFLACIILIACVLQNVSADDGKTNLNRLTDVCIQPWHSFPDEVSERSGRTFCFEWTCNFWCNIRNKGAGRCLTANTNTRSTCTCDIA